MDELVKLEITNIKDKILRLERTQEIFEGELKTQREILGEFDTTQKLILQKLDTIMESIDELKKDSMELKSKPVKSYDKIKGYVIGGSIGAIISFICSIILK